MTQVKHVGQKIAGLRELRTISAEELAGRCGIDVGVLKAIEEGNDPPALAVLIKLARALGVRLGTFLDDTDVDTPVVTRSGEERAGMSISGKSPGAHTHLEFYSLASGKAGRHMEPFVIIIDPSTGDEYTRSSHEGEEFLYVLEGRIEILYGKKSYILQAGDSIYYDSLIEHHVHSAGNEAAKILAVVYAPF
ncbi:MAG TPA: XRE family transcriptional regulator [Bacteroidales bacterium]|nr:XRE family transcriptional regulator [Bacteroidales bacterium]